MSRYTGRLVHVDLAGGAWVLESSGGRIALFGSIPAHLAGEEVEVHGEEIEDGASIAMTGDRMVQVDRVAKVGASR